MTEQVEKAVSATPAKVPTTITFQIKPFKDNERTVEHWQKIVENLISLKSKMISFLISGNSQWIKFYVKMPIKFKAYFCNTFYSSYPTSDLVETEYPKISKERHWVCIDNEARFKDLSDFKKEWSYLDPMNDLLSLFQNVPGNSTLTLFFDYTFKLEESAWKQAWDTFAKVVKRARAPTGWKKEEKTEEKKEENENQIFFSLSYSLLTDNWATADAVQWNLTSVLAPMVTKWSCEFKYRRIWNYCRFSEVVNFFHIPTKINFVKWLEYTLYRKLPYPTNIPAVDKVWDSQKLTLLWDTDYRWDKIRFWIKEEDKFRHVYIVWKTWTWKSTIISNMIISDMNAGNGLCLLDPHGELVDTIIESIPSNRINDVILFDLSDTEYPIWFNLLQADNEDEKNRIASGVVSTFQKLFDNSWWPRLEYILRNVVLSVIEYPNATLMHILRVLTDKDFREEVISHVHDSVLLKFWNSEFNKWQDRQREEAIAPITNKVGQFLSSRLVRNVFGQPRSKLSMRKAMDEGKIILVNLSKGKIWEDNANMIGSLLVTKIQIDAMSRADIPASKRRPFYLYIDEFQNFATKSFATILSEARKYKLSLILANQYTSQLDEDIKNAIFGNVWSIISFTLWYDDAAVMTSQFKELVGVNDLISLPKYTTYTRLMIDGISSDPFNTRTLPPFSPADTDNIEEHIEKIRRQSRQRYAMERTQLESLLNAWGKKTFSPQEKVAEKAKLEAMWLDEEDSKNLQDFVVEQSIWEFDNFMVGEEKADAMVMDKDNKTFKYVWYSKPEKLEEVAKLQFAKWKTLTFPTWKKIQLWVDSYVGTIDKKKIFIWIWKKDEIKKLIQDMKVASGLSKDSDSPLVFIPNVEKLQKKLQKKNEQQAKKPDWKWKWNWKPSGNKQPEFSWEFSVNDIKLWQQYEWYVKLMYNYWMFITVKWVEWLLHKNWIAPLGDGVEWKKYYNIWDKIMVTAKEFKDIDGEKRVVWTQK